MAKDNPISQPERSAQRIIALERELLDTKRQMLQLIDEAKKVKPGQVDPEPLVNYNSPDFDELLNRQMDEATVAKGIVSRVYYGRVVSIHLMGSGAIEIKQQSHHLVQAQTKENKYVPTRVVLSHETFFLMLEAMKFAEDKFGLDRKVVIDKLTGGDNLHFKEAIAFI